MKKNYFIRGIKGSDACVETTAQSLEGYTRLWQRTISPASSPSNTIHPQTIKIHPYVKAEKKAPFSLRESALAAAQVRSLRRHTLYHLKEN